MYRLLNHCIVVTFTLFLLQLWMLYICLLQYVDIIHTIWSLVVLHIGKLFMSIYYIIFAITLLPSSLTCTYNSGLTPPFYIFHLAITCIETTTFIPNFSIFYIFLSILKFFFCLLLFRKLFTFILNIIIHVTKIIFIISLRKCPIFILHILTQAAPMCNTNNKGRNFIFHI